MSVESAMNLAFDSGYFDKVYPVGRFDVAYKLPVNFYRDDGFSNTSTVCADGIYESMKYLIAFDLAVKNMYLICKIDGSTHYICLGNANNKYEVLHVNSQPAPDERLKVREVFDHIFSFLEFNGSNSFTRMIDLEIWKKSTRAFALINAFDSIPTAEKAREPIRISEKTKGVNAIQYVWYSRHGTTHALKVPKNAGVYCISIGDPYPADDKLRFFVSDLPYGPDMKPNPCLEYSSYHGFKIVECKKRMSTDVDRLTAVWRAVRNICDIYQSRVEKFPQPTKAWANVPNYPRFVIVEDD